MRVQLLSPDAVNQAPVAADDLARTRAGQAVDIPVLANDLDPERSPLRIGEFLATDATHGSVSVTVVNTVPALRFVPEPGYAGMASFTYRAEDVLGVRSATAKVLVAVAADDAENRPPEASPDAVRVRRGVEAELVVTANDVDPDGDVLTVRLPDPVPSGLMVVVQGDTLRITARAGANDLSKFDYEVSDGRGGTARAQVLVQVVDTEEPNRAPLANADAATVVLGKSVDVDVTRNDIDPDGDPLTVVSVADVVNGQAVVTGDKVRFTPASSALSGATGLGSFSYAVSDGHGHQATADVSVQVLAEALAQPPYARDDSATTNLGTSIPIPVLDNDGDPSGEQPALSGAIGCETGLATRTGNSVRYTPAVQGADHCAYTIVNSRGLTASAKIVVSVQPPAVVNQPPVALADSSMAIAGGPAVTVDVVSNDTDPDGDPLTLEFVGSATLGRAAKSGNLIVYTPPATLSSLQPESISYSIHDGHGHSVSSTLTMLVAPVVPPPKQLLAAEDTATATAPAPATSVAVLANDSGPNGDASGLMVTSVVVTGGVGTASLSGNTVVMRPDPTFVGTMTAAYTIQDGLNRSASSNVILHGAAPTEPSPAGPLDQRHDGERRQRDRQRPRQRQRPGQRSADRDDHLPTELRHGAGGAVRSPSRRRSRSRARPRSATR